MYCTVQMTGPIGRRTQMKRTLRRILLGSAALVVVVGAATYGTYWFKTGRFLESTDDAYVQADYTTIAPKVSGYIADVKVEDNQAVKAGQGPGGVDDPDLPTPPPPNTA